MCKYFLLFSLLLSSTIFSQKHQLNGIVKDSLDNPLVYVNIVAEHQKKLKSFAFTDEKGRYKLLLKDTLTYDITVTHVSFQPVKFKFKPKKTTSRKSITLKEQGEVLDEVTIKSPIIIKEDTVFYDTKRFTTGKEYKLKSIVKKLPGLEVDRNGIVKFNGRNVKKVYVDDKLFFNGSTKLAVENIPADAVKDIKIIDNHNEVGFLKKVNDSEEVVMDVSLKEDKKNLLFGDVELGKGNKNFYKAHNNSFYHSPKTSVNAIAKINNIGEKTFTTSDYVKFHADKNSAFKGEFDFRMKGFEEFTENSNLLGSVRRFWAGNLIQEINPKWYFSKYLIYSDNTSDMLSKMSNQYPSFQEEKEHTAHTEKSLLFGNMFLEYRESANEIFKFRFKFNNLKKENLENTNTVINTTKNSINLNSGIKKNYFNPKIEWYREHSEKVTLSGIADYKFDEQNNPNFYNSSSLSFFKRLIPSNLTITSPNIFDKIYTRKNYFNTSLKAFIFLKPTSQIHLGLANLYQDEVFETHTHQNENNFEDVFNNTVNYTFHTFLTSVFYRLKKGKIRLKTGLKIKRNYWNIHQNTITEKTKWNILPEINLKYKFHGKKELKFSYKLENNFSDIENFSNKFRINSYTSIFKGNPNLEDELYHDTNIGYTHFNYFKGKQVIARIYYKKAIKGFVYPVKPDDFTQLLTIEELKNSYESLKALINYSKKINKLQLYLITDYSIINNKSLFNNSVSETNNESYSYQLKMKTLFKKFPTIELSYKKMLNYYSLSNGTSKFTTDEFISTIEYDFLDSFKFDLDYSYYDTRNFSQSNFQLLNVSLSYHEDESPWIFKLYGNNILNTTYKQTNSFSDFLISDTKQFLMPRVLMFSAGYKF